MEKPNSLGLAAGSPTMTRNDMRWRIMKKQSIMSRITRRFGTPMSRLASPTDPGLLTGCLKRRRGVSLPFSMVIGVIGVECRSSDESEETGEANKDLLRALCGIHIHTHPFETR